MWPSLKCRETAFGENVVRSGTTRRHRGWNPPYSAANKNQAPCAFPVTDPAAPSGLPVTRSKVRSAFDPDLKRLTPAARIALRCATDRARELWLRP